MNQDIISAILSLSYQVYDLAYHYFLFAGLLYLIFYVWKKRNFWLKKIQQRYPDNKHVIREIIYSILSMCIFGLVGTGIIVAIENGWSKEYFSIDQYGYFYFFISMIIMVLTHDTYFYWTHRLMHWKPIFKVIHKVHHYSNNPTPFAAYAFHPLEAVIEVGIIPIIVFTIPHSTLALTVFVLYSLFLNVIGHLGFEIFPKGFARHKIFKWHNTSTHHNMHHRLVKCNYGLYFNFWDRIMKTNHQEYENYFQEITENNSSK